MILRLQRIIDFPPATGCLPTLVNAEMRLSFCCVAFLSFVSGHVGNLSGYTNLRGRCCLQIEWPCCVQLVIKDEPDAGNPKRSAYPKQQEGLPGYITPINAVLVARASASFS